MKVPRRLCAPGLLRPPCSHGLSHHPHCALWPPSVWPLPTQLGRSRAIFPLHWLERVRLAGVVRASCQVSLGPPVVMGWGGGSQCLTSVSHPRPKNKGFIDLNPDPCFSNHPQPTSHNQHSLILASSRSVRTKQKGLIYTNMGRPGSGKFGGPRGRVWAPVTLNPRAGRVQRMGSCEYSGHPEK